MGRKLESARCFLWCICFREEDADAEGLEIDVRRAGPYVPQGGWVDGLDLTGPGFRGTELLSLGVTGTLVLTRLTRVKESWAGRV